jgi:hypothetical protein
MRFEQVITAVTRPVVVATVREIKAVMSFVNDMRLHLCLQRNALEMPAYTRGLFMSPVGDTGRQRTGFTGIERGRLCLQPSWADATCSVGIRNA